MTSANYRFPREYRLSKPTDFRHVFENAQKSADAFLSILAVATNRGHARLGLAISRKNIRHAADRNRIKRIVRECFRLAKEELGSLDYVVVARAAAKRVENDTLRSALEKHWKILKKRCDSC